MKVLNEYPCSHHYWDEFEKSRYFCPNCGKQEVWEEQGAGDYYVGVTYICAACGAKFDLPSGADPVTEPNDQLRAKQLREGYTAEPTTKKGG